MGELRFGNNLKTNKPKEDGILMTCRILIPVGVICSSMLGKLLGNTFVQNIRWITLNITIVKIMEWFILSLQ